MHRGFAVSGMLLLSLLVQAAEGKPLSRAVLQSKAGAVVASAQADPSGRVRFTGVPPGEYRLVLTSPDGRSLTVSDLDGDGLGDLIIQGPPGVGSGQAATVPKQTQGASFGEKSVGGALPGGAVISQALTSPRDSASGLPTGKRLHRPYCALVDWDGSVKGGFMSEAAAQLEGQRLPENTSGRCAIKVLVEEQPGTIEVLSWSWGTSKANKTGHVTLMK